MSNDIKHTLDIPPSGKARWEVFLEEDWPKHRQETLLTMRKIDDMQNAILLIRQDTQHLKLLDRAVDTLDTIKDSLIEALRGKNVIDVETAKDMLKAQQQTYTNLISTICKIFGLIIVILVGIKVLAPHWFGGP